MSFNNAPNPSLLDSKSEEQRRIRRIKQITVYPPVYHEAYPYRTGLPFKEEILLSPEVFNGVHALEVATLLSGRLLPAAGFIGQSVTDCPVIAVTNNLAVAFVGASTLTAPTISTGSQLSAAFVAVSALAIPSFSANPQLSAAFQGQSALAAPNLNATVNQALSFNPARTYATITLSNSNRTATGTASAINVSSLLLQSFSTAQKKYFEIILTNEGAIDDYPFFGINDNPNVFDSYISGYGNGIGFRIDGTATPYAVGSMVDAGGFTANFDAGDIIGIALDLSGGTKKMWYSKNGLWVGGGNPATGTLPAATFTSSPVYFGVSFNGIESFTIPTAVTYPVPSGFSVV